MGRKEANKGHRVVGSLRSMQSRGPGGGGAGGGRQQGQIGEEAHWQGTVSGDGMQGGQSSARGRDGHEVKGEQVELPGYLGDQYAWGQ